MAGRFFVTEPKYKFVERRTLAFVVSAVLIVVSAVSLGTRGLNLGIDFVGGVMIDTQLPEPDLSDAAGCATDADGEACAQARVAAQAGQIETVRAAINALGYDGASVQRAQDSQRPNAVLIRLRADEGEGGKAAELAEQQASAAVQGELARLFPQMDFASNSQVEVVGPSVSGEFVRNSALAVGMALVLMLAYIMFRFDAQYSAAAILALVHDVFITFGAFSLLQFEFGLSIVAALLTIVGYSMNDTVVVFDRVREELRRYKSMSLGDVINMSINRTLARTVMTSVTTLLALVPLFFFAGETLRGFSFAMIFGVIIGTYSSVFVAAPVLMMLGVDRTSGDDAQALAETP